MTTEIAEKLYTVEEFLNLEWDDDDDGDYELIRGEIVAKPKSGRCGEHGEIISRLSYYLEAYAGAGAGDEKPGWFFTSASSNLGRPAGSSYVEPDYCFVLTERISEKFSGAIPVAPDLVVEVNSPSDTTQKIYNKLEAYKEAGVRLVWSIYMLNKYVVVYRLNDPDAKLLNFNDELDGEDVIPGFTLKVRKLFE